jgi:phosphoribosylamine-glycine ligase
LKERKRSFEGKWHIVRLSIQVFVRPAVEDFDLTAVGHDDVLAAGIVDLFESAGAPSVA